MNREGHKKDRVQSIRKESSQLTKSDIKREVNRVGKKVFVISSIVPAILTIIFLIFEIREVIFYNGFGISNPFLLIWTIIIWAVVIFALPMPAMIGKKLLFTENKKRIFIIIPVITFVICVILGVIYLFIFSPFYTTLVSQILIPLLIVTGISAIIALRLYYKHISESETYEKGVTDKNI